MILAGISRAIIFSNKVICQVSSFGFRVNLA